MLGLDEIKPSTNNPRKLFDQDPLESLFNSIKEHGVLVPITVYKIRGQDKFSILDGERRYRCCLKLKNFDENVLIPANVVDPPNKVAGMLYMFSIHNLREQWELMPTALSLKIVIDDLDENDTIKLSRLTGLSQPQIERCKILLDYAEEFQNLSLEPDTQKRIPANFWIELFPVLELCEQYLNDLYTNMGRDGIIWLFVKKYQNKSIKSVIHFRRIMEAFELALNDKKDELINRLELFITSPDLEIRDAFDEFVVDNKRIQNAVKACNDFVIRLERSQLNHALEKKDLISALEEVQIYIETLLEKLAGEDAPAFSNNKGDLDEEGD